MKKTRLKAPYVAPAFRTVAEEPDIQLLVGSNEPIKDGDEHEWDPTAPLYW